MKTSAAFSLCFVLLGCTSSSAGNHAGDGGTQNGDDGGDDGGGATVTAGEVAFFSGGSGPTSGAYTIVGAFDRGSGHVTGGTSPCDAPVGDCTFCGGKLDGGALGGNLTITLLSAGVLTVKDGASTLATLSYQADDAGMGDYEIDSNKTPSLTWSAGAMLSASATGAAIPAFSADITAPQDIAGLSPALSLTSPVSVPTSSPFVLSWNPSSDGAQMVLVIGGDTGTTASCTVAESAGSVSVPASILQKIGAGGGTMSVNKTVSKPVAVTGATVTIQASAPQVAGSVMLGP